MKVTAAAKVGFTVILLALVLIVVFRGMNCALPWLPGQAFGGYKVYVEFDSVKGLNPGARVQLNGNPIGEVGEITNDPFGGVKVELLIERGEPRVHEHASFTISRDSIFGSYLLSIAEPRAGILAREPKDRQCPIRVEAGTVHVDGLIIKGDTAIGKIISVEPYPYDQRSNKAVIILFDDTPLTKEMAFVPYRPPSGEPGGLIVYDILETDLNSPVGGTREPGPEDLIANADIALRQMTQQAGLIIAQVNELLEDLGALIDADQVSALLDRLSQDSTAIAQNVERLTARLDYMLAENEPHITRTLENVEAMSEEAQSLVAGFNEFSDPKLRDDIRTIIRNMTEASDAINRILEDVEEYTSDDEMRLEVKETIREAHATLLQAQDSLEAADAIMGEASSTIDTVGGIEAGGEFTLRYCDDTERWAGDFDYRIGMESSSLFLTAGVHDIGESERGNVQVGWWISDGFAARAGVHRAKVGLGLDWRSDAARFITDLYDPNDLTWDIYGGYAILPELDVVIGVEDLLKEEELNFGLAFRF